VQIVSCEVECCFQVLFESARSTDDDVCPTDSVAFLF